MKRAVVLGELWASMVFCSNCGVKGADGGKFCMECGTPLSTSAGKPPPPYPGVPSKATAGKKPGVPDQKYTVPSAVPLAASPLAAAPQVCIQSPCEMTVASLGFSHFAQPQQGNQAPPGHFKVQVPMNAVPGQVACSNHAQPAQLLPADADTLIPRLR